MVGHSKWGLRKGLSALVPTSVQQHVGLAARGIGERSFLFSLGRLCSLWLVAGVSVIVRLLNYLDTRIRLEGWEVELVVRAESLRQFGKENPAPTSPGSKSSPTFDSNKPTAKKPRTTGANR